MAARLGAKTTPVGESSVGVSSSASLDTEPWRHTIGNGRLAITLKNESPGDLSHRSL